ncbi:unnamed protein product [Lampetra planeri]
MTWPRSPLFLLLLSSISLLLAETSSDPSRPRNRDSGSRDKSHGDSDVRSLMGGSEMSYKDEEIRPDIRDADSEAADRHSEIRHRDSDIRDADSDIRLEIRDQESRIRHRDPDIRSEIRDKGSRIRHRDSRSRGIDEDITSSGRTFFPQGAIPPPGKGRSNISSSHGHVARHHHQHHQQQQQMLALGLPGGPSSHFHDRDAERQVLASSHEALFVTERRYLRRDWCKSQPLRQTVRERGCVPRTVINRFCYGQCNSFYIPRRATADDDDEGGEGGEGEGDDRGGGGDEGGEDDGGGGGDDDEVLGAPSDSKDLHGGGGGGDDEGIAEAAAAAAGGARGRTARKSSSAAATAGTSTAAGSRGRSSSTAGGKGAAAARGKSSSSSSSGGAGGRGGAGSARRGAASFRACAACRPQRFSSLTVELSCPGLEPPLRRVRLSRVKHCRCVSVRVHD